MGGPGAWSGLRRVPAARNGVPEADNADSGRRVGAGQARATSDLRRGRAHHEGLACPIPAPPGRGGTAGGGTGGLTTTAVQGGSAGPVGHGRAAGSGSTGLRPRRFRAAPVLMQESGLATGGIARPMPCGFRVGSYGPEAKSVVGRAAHTQRGIRERIAPVPLDLTSERSPQRNVTPTLPGPGTACQGTLSRPARTTCAVLRRLSPRASAASRGVSPFAVSNSQISRLGRHGRPRSK